VIFVDFTEGIFVSLLPEKTSLFRRFIYALAVVAAFILLFSALQRLFMPKYAETIPEGGLIREYYAGTMEHDVIFIGDCEVYTGFSTISLWENFGITSFVRGSPQQLMWHSYYLLEDTLRHETPKVVVLGVQAMQHNEPVSEPYNRLTLDGMRLSSAKKRAVAASVLEDEDKFSYFIPFLRYKERWRELTGEDFQFFFRDPVLTVNGFMIRSDTLPADFIPDPLRQADYRFGDKAYHYLERIVELTKENGIELILVKIPNLYPHWYRQWDEQLNDFAEANGIRYINFIGHMEEIGMDFEADSFNGGIHLNVSGAGRLTRYFGEILKEHTELPDRRNEPETAAHWKNKTELYHKVISRQQEEITLTGKIQTFVIG